MKSKSKIVKVSRNFAAIHTDVGVYAVTGGHTTRGIESVIWSDNAISWEDTYHTVQGFRIVPYGQNNELPALIRNIMDENNLAPGILEREIGLLYGDGPRLYRVCYDGGQVSREYVDDPEVWAWLRSWDFRRYIDMATVEYKYLKGFFVRHYLARGARIDRRPMIAKLDVVPAVSARLEWVDSRRLEDVRHIFVGDFENNCLRTGIASYPVYDPARPFARRVSMSYHNTYSFARSFYSVPSYYGTLKWIMRSSDIPDIIRYLTDNGINVAYHVHVPALYWDQKRDKLIEMYPDKDSVFIDKELDKLKDQTFQSMTEVLSGKKNAGKFIDTVDFFDDVTGELCQWKIEPIEQKIKDFIEAQLKISEKADSATTSGLGLHPSLSNIIIGGQLSSGSQMLYALKLYLASDTSIPEEVIFEPVNQAIAANFPDKDVRLGFYHRVVMTEDQVSPQERVKSKV